MTVTILFDQPLSVVCMQLSREIEDLKQQIAELRQKLENLGRDVWKMIEIQTRRNCYRIVKKPFNDINDGQKTIILSKQELRELAIMIIEELGA